MTPNRSVAAGVQTPPRFHEAILVRRHRAEQLFCCSDDDVMMWWRIYTMWNLGYHGSQQHEAELTPFQEHNLIGNPGRSPQKLRAWVNSAADRWKYAWLGAVRPGTTGGYRMSRRIRRTVVKVLIIASLAVFLVACQEGPGSEPDQTKSEEQPTEPDEHSHVLTETIAVRRTDFSVQSATTAVAVYEVSAITKDSIVHAYIDYDDDGPPLYPLPSVIANGFTISTISYAYSPGEFSLIVTSSSGTGRLSATTSLDGHRVVVIIIPS